MTLAAGTKLGPYEVLGPRLANAHAPDGKRLLADSLGEVAAPRIALVANWPGGLTK